MDQPDTTQAAPEAVSTEPQVTTPAEPISSVQPEKLAPEADAKQEGQPTSGAGDSDANKKPISLLDAVKRAANRSSDAASSTVETNGASAKDAKSPAPGLDDPAKDKAGSEADQKLPFHNHPRWKEMVAERDAYRTDAGEYRKITTFMSQNGLSNEEVLEGFKVMALMKTNPAEAHKLISGYKAQLDAFVGEKLPEDIHKKVEEGYIDDDTAKELARLKAEKQLFEQRQQYAMQQQAEQARQSIHSTVVNWEQQMKIKDPDWSAKQDLVTDQVRLMMASEQPNTPDEAIALVERAHSIIKDRLARFAPQRRPVTHVSSATSSANAAAVPKTLLEAVRLGAMQPR